jgi:predicted nucleic acid-binding protein
VSEVLLLDSSVWLAARDPDDRYHHSASELVAIGPDGETVCATVADADEHGLSSYDAAYVTVARRRGWTLVSCDHRDLVGPGHAVTPDDVLARDAAR